MFTLSGVARQCIKILWREFRNTASFKSLRHYSTRSALDSPFGLIPRNNKKYFNWKVSLAFLAAGSYLAYSESLFDFYELFTDSVVEDLLSPIQLEYQLKNLPLYQRLAHSEEGNKWIKLNTWDDLDRNMLSMDANGNKRRQEGNVKYSLDSHTLSQPGGILIKPVTFHNTETDESISIIHVGYRLCGYPFIIHGGILATVLNETFKRNASLAASTNSPLKDDFKVENMSISYKYPSFVNQFLIVKTKKKETLLNDKKNIVLESVIESQNGKILVTSEAFLHDTGRASKNGSRLSRFTDLFQDIL